MSATAGPFLRPSHPQRRRRRSMALRLAFRLARALPALTLPAAAWFWLTDGHTFALSAVETEGSPRIAPDWIERALQPELGSNLLALPLDRVRQRLETHPWLGRIEARKELPSVLHVVVEERVAAAVIETDYGLWYADADGHRIARFEPGDGAGTLLRVAAGATVAGISPALATGEASGVRRALAIEHALAAGDGSVWSRAPLWIEVVGDDDFRLYLGRVPFPVLVRSQGVVERIQVLDRLIDAVAERIEVVAEVDLRFEDRLIARPGAPGAGPGLLEGESVPIEETEETEEIGEAGEIEETREEQAASDVAPDEAADAASEEQPKET